MKPTADPEIEVLLATCNGERFLREQIDSILQQDYPRVRILAADDASRDGTRSILQSCADADPTHFSLLPAQPPSGSAQANFLRLMQSATGEYLAFADQDDVWLPDKLTRSMAAMRRLEDLHSNSKPLLVFSDLQVVNSELRTIAPSMWRQTGIRTASIHRLSRLLGQSVVTGCTILINRPMLLLARRMPPEATMHDRWIALLAASMGAAAVLPVPTVLYRQHAYNVIGAGAQDDSLSGIARRASSSTGRRIERLRSERQAEAFLRIYAAELTPHASHILDSYLRSGRSLSAATRVLLTLRNGFFRDSPLKTFATVLDLARSRSETGLSL